MEGRYCAYLRKSRADEVREKVESDYDALAHHRQTLEALASKMGVDVIRWYCDGIKSGDSIGARPQMQELLEAVQNREWDGVLCMEVERLTRGDMIDQGTVGKAFMESGTLIVTPLKVYDPASEADMEYFEFGLFMSRREYKAINKRLISGRKAAVREGQFIAKEAPYGYDKCVVDGMKTLKPNDDARFIVAVFEAYARGDSYRDIARMLDAMGACPARSAKWSSASVANIVKNPAYIGKVYWNLTQQTAYREFGRTRYKTVAGTDAIVADGLHPPIISDELWEAACDRIAATPARKDYEQKNYYGRILTCAECGKALHYSESGNAKEPMFVHLRRGEGCQTKGCRVSRLDAVFCGALESIANDIEVSTGDAPDMRRHEFERSIAEASAAIEANFDRMERGIISEDDFVRRRKVLEERIEGARKMLDELPDENQERLAVTLKECIRAIQDPDVSVESKRKLIWSVVDRIEYMNRATQGKDDIKLDIYLR